MGMKSGKLMTTVPLEIPIISDRLNRGMNLRPNALAVSISEYTLVSE